MSPNVIAPLMGLLQGFSEFLPISSSGHLRLFSFVFSQTPIPLFFDILLHLATLLAILYMTRRLLVTIVLSLFRSTRTVRSPHAPHSTHDYSDSARKDSIRLVFSIILSTLCTVAPAFLIRDFVFQLPLFVQYETLFVGLGFLCTAIALFLPSLQRNKTLTQHNTNLPRINLKTAIIMGLVQGITLMPGISRSGLTIVTALLLGNSRKDSVHYSFLLSIPIILASFFLSLENFEKIRELFSWQVIAASLLLAFLSGLLGLYFLRHIVKVGKLWVFSLYLFPLSLLTIYLQFFL